MQRVIVKAAHIQSGMRSHQPKIGVDLFEMVQGRGQWKAPEAGKIARRVFHITLRGPNLDHDDFFIVDGKIGVSVDDGRFNIGAMPVTI